MLPTPPNKNYCQRSYWSVYASSYVVCVPAWHSGIVKNFFHWI